MRETWKYLFRPVILERGEDVYYGGGIDQIRRTADGWEAVAHGTWDYRVSIDAENDKVTEMSCTCPYAEDGHNCKHMAGLLFALEENDFEEEDEEGEREDAYDVLASMSEEELREELRAIMNEDSTIRSRIYSRYRKTPVRQDDIRRIGMILEGLADRIGDRYGFIDWRSGSEYVRAFSECLYDNLEPMLVRGEYMPAFEILKKAFQVLNTVEMDGSGGEHGDIASDIESYWDRIIHMASSEERDTMHKYFMDMRDLSDQLICYDSVDNVLENSFDDEKYLRPLIEESEEMLKTENLSPFRERAYLERYKSLLARCRQGEKKYEEWLNAHADHTAVKEIRLEEARERNDPGSEIILLKDLYDRESSDCRRAERLRELSAAYGKANDRKHEKSVLKTILTEYGGTLSEAHRLRELSTQEEWEKTRGEILERNEDLRIPVFHEEKLYDRLIRELTGRSVTEIEKYRRELQDQYPAEILHMYMRHLEELSERHPCRSLYNEMTEYIRKTAEIPGGSDALHDLFEIWYRRYPTRKMMMEMLREASRYI